MKSWNFLLLLALSILLLAGCSTTSTDDLCPPEYLVAPVFVSPADLARVNTLTPTLEWSIPEIAYPFSASGKCHPEQFRLTLKKGPLFVDAMGAMVDGTQTTWTAPALEAGSEYQWSVAAVTNNESGPFSGIRKFYVGENCASPINAPTLLQPFNGAMVFNLIPTLMWQSNSSCVPYGYRVEIATDPAFSNMVLNLETGTPATSYTIFTPLANCTRYYWRVGAMAGKELEPYSETYSFRVATEGCDAEPGSGSIVGTVWQDICSLPQEGPIPNPLPYGCVTSASGPIANGIVNPGESGIGSVVVRVGAGTCSSNTPLGLTMTNEYGMYMLAGLQAGTYCVSIDSTENPIWLGSGWWTYPPGAVGNPTAQHEVILASEENKFDINYGWQFEFAGPNTYNLLGGYVYHDMCPVPHGVEYNNPLPDGCRQHDGWVTGDYIQQPNEPGIAGIEVEVHTPLCSDPISQVTTTDENGFFSFMLEPGTPHCVLVKSQTSPNKEILQPGVWSAQPNLPTYQHQFMYNGQSANHLDFFSFGWDYSNLPKLITPVEVPLLYPKFKVDLQTNCRAGPSRLWQSWVELLAGMEFEIKGITPMMDWIYITPIEVLNKNAFSALPTYPAGMSCWVSLGTGKTEGDLGKAKLMEGPMFPTPTPTLVPINCSDYKSASDCNAHSNVGCSWKTALAGTVARGECIKK
jgi:hypothetical protein